MEEAHSSVPGRFIWRFPKIRGTILGVPIIRTTEKSLYWGTLILGNYHIVVCTHGSHVIIRFHWRPEDQGWNPSELHADEARSTSIISVSQRTAGLKKLNTYPPSLRISSVSVAGAKPKSLVLSAPSTKDWADDGNLSSNSNFGRDLVNLR